MYRPAGLSRRAGILAGLLCLLGSAGSGWAQTPLEEGFTTGKAAAAWQLWQPAMQAILERNLDKAEELFGQLLELQVSPLRVALLADRTTTRTPLGGAILLLEQDYENDALAPNGRRIAEALATGREQMNQADDAWYFSVIGRFDVAAANFDALLASDPDPIALLEFTDQVPRRREVLSQLATHEVVGEAARGVLKLLDRGEELVNADPTRIKNRLEALDGPPRAIDNSVALLQESGEYAVPFIVQYLRDPAKESLTQGILRALPAIGRPALNPLVYALRVEDPVVLDYLVTALGQIGYPQAYPYLLQLQAREGLTVEVRSAVQEALAAVQQQSSELTAATTAAEAFFQLAEAYYEDASSLAADPRLDTANVWYWREGILQNIAVPTMIFNEIMCMRCCEEALLADPNLKPAQALWVAANFRRAAQLPEGADDDTRPENNPSPTYFAQTAGPDVCLMALSRALDHNDPAVALGVIEALRNIGGPATITADEEGRLPLAEALLFPDRMVRIRAALTLGNARPTEQFLNYQNLTPVLAEALQLHGGGRTALVVDADQALANALAATLREDGYEVQTDTSLFAGLQKVRTTMPSLDLVVLASNSTDAPLPDALRQMRAEFRFASTPVVIVAKPGTREMVRELVGADHRVTQILPDAGAAALRRAIERVSHAVGVSAVTPETGAALALETARTLQLLAVSRNPLFPPASVEPALIGTLTTADPELRLAVAAVLAHVCSEAAQEALAQIALDSATPAEMRIAMFGAVAEAGKLCGNHLPAGRVDELIAVVEKEPDMALRTAASQALGALNLPANKGSEIIRNQYGG